ncbi:MAG: hypothetical protein ACI9KE_000219 [Polyangiales bacterium]|jgi:hypothetical protein
MDRVLEQLFEYGSLRSAPVLSEESAAHRRLLERVLGSSPPWVALPPAAMEQCAAYPARFTVVGGFAQGEVRSLSGGGLWIATRAHVPLGTNVLVRFDDSEFGSYLFPSIVAARRVGRSPALGMQFNGPPERSAFDSAWTPRFTLRVGGHSAVALVS